MRRFLVVAIACALAIGACSLALPARAELKAGAARVSITPDVPAKAVPLGGYSDRLGKPATGVHDPVCAKALVLDDGQTRLAIVGLDLLDPPPNMCQAVFERLGGLLPEVRNLLLCATHTHSAPAAMNPKGDLLPQVLGKFDQELYDWTADRIADAVKQAASRLTSAKAGAGSVYVWGFNRNRRDEFGHTTFDPELTVLKVTDAQDNLLALLLNFSAHGTILGGDNMLISAEWPGAMERYLEQQFPGCVAAFINGAQGDQSPVAPEASDVWGRVEGCGKSLGEKAAALIPDIAVSDSVPLAVAIKDTQLPPPTLPPGLLELDLGIDPAVAQQIAGALFPASAPMGVVRVGDLFLLAVPGEMMAGLGQEIKDAVKVKGAKHPVIAGLANAGLGYILRPEDYLLGGYEASVSFYGPQMGFAVQDALLAAADQVLKPSG